MWDLDTEEGMAQAKEWLAHHATRITEGGLWLIPRTHSVYQIWNGQKRVRCQSPSRDGPTDRVFIALGWKVE
jgi:hypothetical protein